MQRSSWRAEFKARVKPELTDLFLKLPTEFRCHASWSHSREAAISNEICCYVMSEPKHPLEFI